MPRATSRTAAVSTCGSRAVFRASAATVCLMAAPVSSCGCGRPGRTHRSRSGAVHALVTTAGSRCARVLAMSASWSSSPRGSLTSTPVAVAVMEFSHLTKPCASVPQMPAAGWSARGSSVLSGLGARVSARNSQYRSAGTGRAQTRVPAPVVSVRRVRRAAITPAMSRRCAGEQSGSSARWRSWSSRWRSSGSISAPASSQSKASVRAGTVPLSRHARTIMLTSAVAAYSRMVSCHHGSLTSPARLLIRSELALTCRAARYSWNVRCAKAYRPAGDSTSRPLRVTFSRNASPVTDEEKRRSCGSRISSTRAAGSALTWPAIIW